MMITDIGTFGKPDLGNVFNRKVSHRQLENFMKKGINFQVFRKPKIFGALANTHTH